MNSSDCDWQSSCSTIQHANLHLLKSGKFSDVVFLVGESKIPVHAHKLILMSRSSVFETMFERWETQENCQIEIPEVTHKSFQLYLEYLYADTFSVAEEDAAEVLYLAHKYSSMCSDLLKSAIQIGNVIHIYQVASRLDQVALRTQAMKFILKNGKSVFQDVGFLEIDSETLSTVFKDDRLAVDELTVFQAVMRWAENRCKVQKLGNTVKNKRTILKNLLPLIRFPGMRPQDFTDEVVRKNKGILTHSETIAVYMDFTTESTNRSLPALPFNRNKRFCPDEIYTIEAHSLGTGYFQDHCCRKDYGLIGGATYECVSTLIFSSSRNISLNGIELYGFQEDSGVTERHVESKLVKNSKFTLSIKPTKRSIVSSVNLTSEHLKNLFSSSSFKIEFDNEISMSKSEKYEMKLTCIGGTVQSGRVQGRSGGVLRKSARVTSGSTTTTFSFISQTTQCGLRNVLGCNGYSCLCAGRIKTIHFTL